MEEKTSCSEDDLQKMMEEFASVANDYFIDRPWRFRMEQRQIKDHWHIHAVLK